MEIVADRGIAARVAPQSWQEVCRGMEQHLRQSRHLDAILQGVDGVSELLAEHAPARDGEQRNELSNWPAVVKG